MNKVVKRKEKADKFEEVRRKLIAMRQDIIKEVKAGVVQILREEDKYNGVSDDGDFADVAFREAMQESIFSRQRSRLREIEEALRKISEGSYGICDDCGEEIPMGRLNVKPFALRCVDCQESHEQMSSGGEETAMPPPPDTGEGNES